MSKIMGSWQAQYLYLVLLNFAIALGILTNTGDRAFAQIVPDSTLPNNSTVNLEGNTSIITGGTNRGSNLFHSFQEFSIPRGATAYFNNAIDIQNIITRVHGGSISNIDGLIRANGNANLFILNPNGIIFGANASLDIGGSFFATTASSIKFADGFEWSANTSSTTPILTISIPTGLQFGKNSGRIEVRGDGQGIRTKPQLIDTKVGLRVEPNQTLGLVGGDVNLEGATLKTAGGRIELGSIAQESLVNLSRIDKGFSLGYEGVQNFGNIQLSQQTAVDASGEGGGDIQVVGKGVTIRSGSQIEASTLGSKPGGAVVINASELVEVVGVSPSKSQISSSLGSKVYSRATGSGSDLKINTNELLVREGAVISTHTSGAGKGGNLTLNGSERVEVIGVAKANEISIGLLSLSDADATGGAGDLTINTGELLVRDGAVIGTFTNGAGKGGNLTVNASERVEVTGIAIANANRTGFLSSSGADATGRAGDLTINTGELLVRDGAFVTTITIGEGNGGNLTVNASERVQVIGVATDAISAGLTTESGLGITGAAGDLAINTGELLVRDGAIVSTSTAGTGNAGNLTVNAPSGVQLIGTRADGSASQLSTDTVTGATGRAGNIIINTSQLLVRDGAQVSASTSSTGNAGNLNINASDSVQLIGTSADRVNTGLFTDANSIEVNATGAAGNLIINTRVLQVQNGATIGTIGVSGNGGSLTVNATNSVQLIGTAKADALPTSLTTSSRLRAEAAGNLVINTSKLLIDGALVTTGTLGAGKGGSVTVNASDRVQLTGTTGLGYSLLTARTPTGATGSAGDMTINTRELLVQDGSQISTDTDGAGNSGNLVVNASKRVQLDGTKADSISGSSLFSGSGRNATGTGGNLTINTSELLVQNGAKVAAATFGSGKAGNLTVNASGKVQLIGSPGNEKFDTGLFTSAFLNSTGTAGNITINTQELVVRDRAVVTAQSVGTGNAGNLEVNARSVRLENFGVLSADTLSINTDPNKQQATINLRSQDLVLLGGSRIVTNARGKNVVGGNININTGVLGAFQNSDITANSADFRGGRVQIKAQGIFGTQSRNVLTPQSDITATGASPQLSGTIELNILEANPTQELVELPKGILDVSQLIGQNLCVASDENEFIITGRGGLPNSPEQALQADAGWEDWRILHESRSDIEQQAVSVAPSRRNYQSFIQDNLQQEIVEAQGWMVDSHGDVLLVANPVTVTPDSFWSRSHDCQT